MIRKIVLFTLALLLLLAAGLMTALLIFRHPTPAVFQQATTDRPIRLPQDEAAHFDVRAEWWYYTGFLNGSEGQEYGFELVFFKVYASPQMRIGGVLPIPWISNPLYFAHFAVSDQAARKHTFFERSNFPRFWEAGARADRYQVWNGDWRAWGGSGTHHLQAAAGPYKLQLDLEAARPAVWQSPQGVEDMGRAGTSYYYSYTDLRGHGLFSVNGQPQTVTATAWMDHQWGSWQMHNGFAGWDWFSLRLDDDRQVMLFLFRDDEGHVLPESGGTWIAADGQTRFLHLDDYTIEALDFWTSPETGAVYPIRWHILLPAEGLDLTVAATFPEQEMTIQLGPIYWEGSVTIEGTASGKGYVELTGYAP